MEGGGCLAGYSGGVVVVFTQVDGNKCKCHVATSVEW